MNAGSQVRKAMVADQVFKVLPGLALAMAIGLDANWLALRIAGLKPIWLGLSGMLTATIVAVVGARPVAR